MIFTFFFSVRRRHTRFSRDWSSDVCSSDLEEERGLIGQHGLAALPALGRGDGNLPSDALAHPRLEADEVRDPERAELVASGTGRSEERRGGKEGGWRG